MAKELQNIDPRQVEFFLSKPGVTRRLGVQGTERMSMYVKGERERASWLREGNIILENTEEWVKKEDWDKLDRIEQDLLKKVGTERFNETISNSLRIGNRWYGGGTDIFKVFSVLRDGAATYEAVEEKTGFSRNKIDKFIKELVKGGYLQPTAETPPPSATDIIRGTGGLASRSTSNVSVRGTRPSTSPRPSRGYRGNRMAGSLRIRGGLFSR